MHDTLVGRGRISYEPYTLEEQYEEQKRAQAFLNNEIEDIEIHSIRQVKELFFQFKNLYRALLVKQPNPDGENSHLEGRDQMEEKNSKLKTNTQISNKIEKVGTINNKFGFSLGKSHPASKPPIVNNYYGDDEKENFDKLKNLEEEKQDLQKQLYKKESNLDYENMELKTNNQMESEIHNMSRKQMFEEYKQSKGEGIVVEIRDKVKEITSIKSEIDMCISTCNDLKKNIDEKFNDLKKYDSNKNGNLSEEEYKLHNEIKNLKNEHKYFLTNYKDLKKKFKSEEKNLIKKKQNLVNNFENYLSSINYECNEINAPIKGKDLIKINAQEATFIKAKQKFETLKKIKKYEKIS